MKRIARLPGDNAASALVGHEELQRIVRRHLPPSTAALYARPRQVEGGIVEWYSDLGGQPVPFSELPPSQAAEVRHLLDERLVSIQQLATHLQTQGEEGARQAALLREAASPPDPANLYVLNGQPLLTAWGGGPTPPPALVSPPPPPVRPWWRRWWWLLLLLLLLVLLGALLWWYCWRTPALPAPPPVPPVAEETAPPVPPAAEEITPPPVSAKEPPPPPPEDPPPAAEEEPPSVTPPEPEPPAELPPPPTPPTPPPPRPPPPPPDPMAELDRQLQRLGGNCSALQELQRNESNAQRRERINRQLLQHCRAQMITQAKDLCPSERPPELAPELVIVFDASGSMDISLLATPDEIKRAARTQGAANVLSQILTGNDAPNTMQRIFREPKRITAAKQAAIAVVRQLPNDVNAGLVLVESCPAARSAGFFPPARRGELLQRLQRVTPVEGTPLGDGIAKAGAMLDGVNRESVMLVVSDGEESCNRDPCAVARELARRKPHLTINVIDILGTGAGNCLATATGGRVYTANNARDLQLMTTQAARDVLPPAHCRQ